MKKCWFTVISVVLFSLVIGGCASQKSWIYTPNTYGKTAIICNKKAVVLPFTDARKNTNNNKVLLYMIPLMPYGWADYNAPEGQQAHINSGLWTNYKPTEDFAKALAQELQNANIFQEAYFDFKKGDSGMIIKGEILSTKYDGKIISYGLSVYGPLLWFIGLPAGTVSNELSVRLACVDSESGETIFSKSYDAPRYREMSWIYALKNDFNYSSMLKGINEEFVEDLRRKVQPVK